MPIVRQNCKECGVPIEILAERTVFNLTTYQYKCGHFDFVKKITRDDFKDFVSLDGKRPYKFQIDGAVWGLENNARVAILDEMGLGKTVQAAMIVHALWKSLDKPKAKDFTVLVLCKKSLKFQWMKEMNRWCGDDWIGQILNGENDFLIPGMRVRFLSMDMPWRFKNAEEFIQRTATKVIILDEVQHIKNSDSKRTNGIRALCKHVEHIIALSGTPIKNHAGEYFPLLNLLSPSKFRTMSEYQQMWVDSYWDGYKMKYGGIKNFQRFSDYTGKMIKRRTRSEVMPDLPVIQRDNRFTELGDVVENAYKDLIKQYQQYYNYDGMNDTASMRNANILAYLSKMRHLTGIAKIEPTVEFVDDFLTETDRKLTIFVHHKDVAETLRDRLLTLANCPEVLLLHSGLSDEQRYEMVEKFKSNGSRVMIASTLASGEGLNLQFCSDCIMMERQWNPANEEQAESRFIRIGQLATAVTATYMTAVGTVDEFFAKLVEQKRAVVSNTLDGTEAKWEESSLLRELADVIAVSGGQHWGW